MTLDTYAFLFEDELADVGKSRIDPTPDQTKRARNTRDSAVL